MRLKTDQIPFPDNVPPQDIDEEGRDVGKGISQPFVAKIANRETAYQYLMGFY